MQVRVKTPRIRVEIDGEIPRHLLDAVKRDFPEDVEILEAMRSTLTTSKLTSTKRLTLT